jgi:SAM-dependent methyltransferase
VAQWVDRLGTLRDVVRQELVARQLREHLSPPDESGAARIVDVGCGQGTQAIRLAAAGYQVTGIDRSAELLDHAWRTADAEPEVVQRRLRWQRGELFDFAAAHASEWDLVCCHGVVMYLPSLPDAVRALVGLARPGGLVSILTRNQPGIAMRAGMSRRWADAVHGFDADRYTNRLGLADVRADRPEAVQAALSAVGAETVGWYGVRLFTDHWDDEDIPADLDALLDTEEQAGRRDPYRRLTALTHTLARRRG